MTHFNPNDPGTANGNFFALPYSTEDSDIIIIPVPWDVTTSYRPGTNKGPQSIIDASVQVDLYDSNIDKAWETRIGTHNTDISISEKNRKFRKLAEEIISHLESGGNPDEMSESLSLVNNASEELNIYIRDVARGYMVTGKTPVVVGGDHSVPLGNMMAVGEMQEDFGILHIDAHADLRIAYEGFTCSHASIIYNALERIPQISQLTQVGIRDYCQQEADIINTDPRIRCYTDKELRAGQFNGKNWHTQCEEIVSTLPSNIYISLDIDGLSPDLCPNTGTPVPGGLSFNELDYLLWMVANSGKNIKGFDLCEVAPGDEPDEWDANVGARILYKMCLYTSHNSKKNQLISTNISK